MKFEEKVKKNKNCEISHIVRPAETPEVYNQKQNTLFIIECVEHRMSKLTWARLRVYSVECSGVCTVKCIWVYARSSVFGRMHSPAVRDARLGPACGSAVRDDGSDGRAAPLFVAHGTDECAARIFVMQDSDGRATRLVVVHGLVGMCPRFGRDAWIGCTRAKLYGHD